MFFALPALFCLFLCSFGYSFFYRFFFFTRVRRAEENLVLNNKDNGCLCLGTIGLIVAPWKFDLLKTSYVYVRGATNSQ